MSLFKQSIADTISDKYPDLKAEEIISYLEKPKNSEFGDVALPCFRFAKIFRKSPMKIAEELEMLFAGNSFFESITNVGGYLNFKFSKQQFVASVLEQFKDDAFYKKISSEGEGKTLVIDFSSPNIAKKMHLGTFRSTAIGNAIQKIYRAKGWSVKRINHLGDWGTQFGKLMSAFKGWGVEEELEKNPMMYLQKLYVEFNKKSDNQPELLEEAREWFSKLEQGDAEAKELWERFRKFTIDDLNKSYRRIGVEFDYYWGEAFYEQYLADMIKEIEESSISSISEGALVVDLEEYKMPPCLIRKSNGTSIYATRDLAAAKYRYEHFKFDKMMYVVGSPQLLHFNQVFKTLELLGYDWSKNCEFVGFGQILGLSTRKGTAVYLDELFDEAKSRIIKVIDEKNPDMENKEDIADKIGIGAIIFQDLSKARIKDSEFDWERVLAFDGETGPYVQYTYVRIYNILQKIDADFNFSAEIDNSILTDDASYELISLLAEYPKKLNTAFTEAEPYLIANYLIELSKSFNRFYRSNRVVGEDKSVVAARAYLLNITKELFEKCMDIIGIPAITRM